jgi:hypothetical protein
MRWCVGLDEDAAEDVWACRIEGRSDLAIEVDILGCLAGSLIQMRRDRCSACTRLNMEGGRWCEAVLVLGDGANGMSYMGDQCSVSLSRNFCESRLKNTTSFSCAWR